MTDEGLQAIPEGTSEQEIIPAHDCIRDADFKKLRAELRKGHKVMTYQTEELSFIKDALGVKDLQNGDRDRKLRELQSRADTIGRKAEEKDDTLYSMVTELRVDMAAVKQALGLNQQNKQNRFTFFNIVLSAILGFLFVIAVELIRFFTWL